MSRVLDVKLQLIIIFYLRILVKEDSRQITRELVKGINVDHSTVERHLSAIGKIKTFDISYANH